MLARLAALAANCLGLVAAPLVAYQATKARREILRLPEALGSRQGFVEGADPVLQILIVGDSTTVGVGVADMVDALPVQFANQISAGTGRGVQWRVLGKGGATLSEVNEQVLRASPTVNYDLVLVSVGVNDTKNLTRLSRWRSGLEDLLRNIACLPGTPNLLVAGVPPMSRFPSLPAPLSWVLGLRALALEQAALKHVGATSHARYVAVDKDQPPEFMSNDQFHPSSFGYEKWSAQLVQAIADWV